VAELLQEINNIVNVFDSGILVHLKKAEDHGLHLEVSYTNIDKIIGLKEIKKIINKHIQKYGIEILSIGLKK
jgi:hypothetical protein